MTDKDELILKYFQGTLAADEELVFNSLLKDDPEFKQQFEFEKDVQAVIKSKEQDSLKKKLQDYENQRPLPVTKKRSSWSPLRIAASIAILLTAGFLLYNLGLSSSPEELYASNYEPYPNTVYAITRDNTEDNSLERKAFGAYEANDIETAIRYFQDLRQNSGLDYVDFYLAQAYLANNDIQKAVPLFEKVVADNTDFKSEALWYAALGNLKTGQESKATQQLEALILDGSYKKEEATALLKALK